MDRTLLPSNHQNVKVCIANTTNKSQPIPIDTYLGHAIPVTVMTSDDEESCIRRTDSTPCTEKVSHDIIKPVLEKLPVDVTAEQRQQVINFFQEFDDMFSRGTFDMGQTTLVEHSIDTGDHRPIRESLRRHPLALLDEIDHQVDELIDNDFIEPAASPWASNVVMVKKKDGSFRLCVDYRRLNSVTYKDSYPLPHIDTCLGSMNGAVWFSTLDL